MGSLTLPASGMVYIDTAPIIYGIEKNPDFSHILLPLWQSAQTGQVTITTSALTLLEVLVLPIKQNDTLLIQAYEQALTAAETQLIPITNDILRQAANIRAQFNLKTPDAIHAASGLVSGCVQFITNDSIFRRVTGLNVVVLHEII